MGLDLEVFVGCKLVLITLMAGLFSGVNPGAWAENNGLAVDAAAKGYVMEILDVGFGSTSLTMGEDGITVSMTNLRRNGRPVPAVADQKVIWTRVTEICVDMFQTPYRSQNYKISGLGYFVTPANSLEALQCLFTKREAPDSPRAFN